MAKILSFQDAYMKTIGNNEEWDRYFLSLAKLVSTRSKDPSTKVGAVLINPHTHEVISTGYNGFPRGVRDFPERYNDRELKYQLVVHAEENAIIHAGNKAKGGWLYVYPSFDVPPICSRCCASAIQAGIKGIVGFKSDGELDERQKRWSESIKLSKMMCNEAGILYYGLKEKVDE